MKNKLLNLSKWVIYLLYPSYLALCLRYMRFNSRQIVIIIGTPLHSNIGDLAITLAEQKFIDSYMSNDNYRTVKIPLRIFNIIHRKVSRIISSDDVLVGLGGGNMGDQYIIEEECRRKIIASYPNNKIIIFPQTIHFSNTKNGQTELRKTKKIYSRHTNLVIVARENNSYEQMIGYFPNNKILLTPDIVLSMNESDRHYNRYGVLVCMRNDIEGKLKSGEKNIIDKISLSLSDDVRYTDTISKKKLIIIRRKNSIVYNKLSEFQQAKLVITDRLHGMVFSAITGTPCVAFSNYNHKVLGTYKWISKLPYIKFCDNVSELGSLVNSIDLDNRYSYDPNMFKKYWVKIRRELGIADNDPK